MQTFHTHAVGANFRPADARELIKQLEIGDLVYLEREPGNPYDARAIKVLVNDANENPVHIGYIPKDDNGVMSQLLDAGESYTAELIGFAGTLKPTILVEFPEENVPRYIPEATPDVSD